MSAGILELTLVFGVVLALAVFDLMATKRSAPTREEQPPEKVQRGTERSKPAPGNGARNRAKKNTRNET
jgi:hypothetical protein